MTESKAISRLGQVKDFLTGHKTATTIPFDPNCTKFPSRKDVPRREGAPDEAAWVWGHSDSLGRLNLLTPTRVLAASSLIQSGDLVPLSLPLDIPKTPAWGRAVFKHEILPHSDEGVGYDDSYSLNTQSGTQWDGFRHVAHGKSKCFYNGVTSKDIEGPERNDKIGVSNWAEHGIAGRGVLLDYWGYAKEKGIVYDPFKFHAIPYSELDAAGKYQGLDIRPAAQGGDIEIGDLLFVRSGWVDTYHSSSPEERTAAAERKEIMWAGVKQEEAMIDWLHDCYFSAVAGDAPAFEAWPTPEKYLLHEYLLALWGVPIGEMFDLEKLASTCREKGRWTFFITSAPNNCVGGVASHGNAMAIF